MPDEQQKPTSTEDRFRRFIKIFEDTASSAEAMAAISKKQIEILNKQIEVTNKLIEASAAVFEAISAPKDGAVAAVDDLIVEIQGLRDDLRAIAKAGGLAGLTSLFGGGRRGR